MEFQIRLLLCLVFGLFSAALRAEPAPLKMGAFLCLSGECAECGTNALKGVQLAVEEINASGGVLGRPISLAIEDSSDPIPARAVNAFKKLSEDPELRYFIGPTWSVGGMPVAPLIARRPEIIVTSPSVGLREFNETARNILNVWPHDEIATRLLARYVAQQGWKRAAIFSSEDPWVKAQSATFEAELVAQGGSIVARALTLPDAREVKAETLRLVSAKPDVIFLGSYQYDTIAKELGTLRYRGKKVGILMERERVKNAQGALEDTLFAMYEKPREEFRQAFFKKYGVEAGIAADTGYDIVKLYAQAIETAGTVETAKTLAVLLGIKNFSGASGTFSMDEKGAVSKSPVLWKIKNGEYERVN